MASAVAGATMDEETAGGSLDKCREQCAAPPTGRNYVGTRHLAHSRPPPVSPCHGAATPRLHIVTPVARPTSVCFIDCCTRRTTRLSCPRLGFAMLSLAPRGPWPFERAPAHCRTRSAMRQRMLCRIHTKSREPSRLHLVRIGMPTLPEYNHPRVLTEQNHGEASSAAGRATEYGRLCQPFLIFPPHAPSSTQESNSAPVVARRAMPVVHPVFFASLPVNVSQIKSSFWTG